MRNKIFLALLLMLSHFANAKDFDPIFVDKAEGTNKPVRLALDSFDNAVLSTCGTWGKIVSRHDLEGMLNSRAGDIKKIYDATGGYVRGTAKVSLEQFKVDLLNLLDSRNHKKANNFFQHVFCGTVNSRDGKLGGLHYFARLMEVQDKKWGGYYTDSKCAEREGKQGMAYAIGFTFPKTDGSLGKKCPLSFVNGMHATEVIATAINGLHSADASEQKVCFYKDSFEGNDLYFKIVRNAIDGNLTTVYVVPESGCDTGSKLCNRCESK